MKMSKSVLMFVSFLLAAFAATAAGVPSIHMAGDSTMCDYKVKERAGWGQILKQKVKDNVTVNNRAVGGQSTKSFIESKRWSKLLAKVKKGDYVIIQFGHNDQKKTNEKRYAAANGAYKDNLRKFISDVKAKEAKIVLATPVCRRTFGKNGKLTDRQNLKEYAVATMEIAKEMNVPVIDLNTISCNHLNLLGKEKSLELFLAFHNKKDNTHTTIKGAEVFSSMFIEDAKKQKLEIAELFK